MKSILMNNGNLMVPQRVSDGNFRGHIMIEIDNTHENYVRWLKFSISEREARKRGMLREK